MQRLRVSHFFCPFSFLSKWALRGCFILLESLFPLVCLTSVVDYVSGILLFQPQSVSFYVTLGIRVLDFPRGALLMPLSPYSLFIPVRDAILGFLSVLLYTSGLFQRAFIVMVRYPLVELRYINYQLMQTSLNVFFLVQSYPLQSLGLPWSQCEVGLEGIGSDEWVAPQLTERQSPHPLRGTIQQLWCVVMNVLKWLGLSVELELTFFGWHVALSM